MKTKMKIFKVSLLTGLFFISLTALATNTPTPSGTVTGEAEKTIRQYFKFPQVLLPQYESKTTVSNKVEVFFTTGENGRVNFVWAKTSNQKLKAQVEKDFAALYLDKLKHNVVHTVVLNFKTL
jgi:hypothetical protein